MKEIIEKICEIANCAIFGEKKNSFKKNLKKSRLMHMKNHIDSENCQHCIENNFWIKSFLPKRRKYQTICREVRGNN